MIWGGGGMDETDNGIYVIALISSGCSLTVGSKTKPTRLPVFVAESCRYLAQCVPYSGNSLHVIKEMAV